MVLALTVRLQTPRSKTDSELTPEVRSGEVQTETAWLCGQEAESGGQQVLGGLLGRPASGGGLAPGCHQLEMLSGGRGAKRRGRYCQPHSQTPYPPSFWTHGPGQRGDPIGDSGPSNVLGEQVVTGQALAMTRWLEGRARSWALREMGLSAEPLSSQAGVCKPLNQPREGRAWELQIRCSYS